MTKRGTVWGGALYVVCVLGAVVYGVIRFGSVLAPGPMRGYPVYLLIVDALLALYLGIWAALSGLRQPLHGVALLLAGILLTALLFILLPVAHIGTERYSAPALWLMGAAWIYMCTWLVTTLVGRAVLVSRDSSHTARS